MKQGKKLLILPAVAVLLGMGTGCSGNSENEAQNMAKSKHSKKCTFYILRFGCSFAAVNTIKPQLL